MFRLLLLAGLGLLAPFAAPREFHPEATAQDEKKVTVRWYGQSFFEIETSLGKKIVFDPHAMPHFGRPTVDADIVLLSHEHNDHNQLGSIKDTKAARVFRGLTLSKTGKADWNRVDEKVGQARLRTLSTYHDPLAGMQRGKNTAWIVEVDGLVFCHLGDLGHELTPEQLKAIGEVDVLMIPIGGIYTINGEQAKNVAVKIKPKHYILPMHYGVPGFDELAGPEEFLDGQKNVKKMLDTNELVIPVDPSPPTAPTIVLLNWTKK